VSGSLRDLSAPADSVLTTFGIPQTILGAGDVYGTSSAAIRIASSMLVAFIATAVVEPDPGT
jgi:hypothetical protein